MVPPDAVTCSREGTSCSSPWGQVHIDHLTPPHDMSTLTVESLLQFSHISYDSQIRAHVQNSNATNTDASQSNNDWEEKFEEKLTPVLSKFKKTHEDVVWNGEHEEKYTLPKIEDESHAKGMLDYFRCALGAGDKSSCRPPPSDTKDHLQEIMKFMWYCYEDESCRAMRISLMQSQQNPTTIILKAFMNKGGEVLPRPKSKAGKWALEIDGVSLHKYMPPSKDASMPSEVREQLPESQQQTLIYNEYKGQCRCSQTKSASGCAVYYEDGRPHFWCYIENKTLANCHRNKYKVYKVAHKYWTEDICPQSQKNGEQCRCSGQGLPPPLKGWTSKAKSDRQHSLQHASSPWKQGTSCAAWDEDRPEWCIVGFDTTCIDKRRVVYKSNAAYKKTFKIPMDVSYAACSRGKLLKLLHVHGRKACTITVKALIVVLCFFFVTGIIAQDVLFEYVKNRCGDHIAESHAAGQGYAVEEDSMDEDEFQVKSRSRKGADTHLPPNWS